MQSQSSPPGSHILKGRPTRCPMDCHTNWVGTRNFHVPEQLLAGTTCMIRGRGGGIGGGGQVAGQGKAGAAIWQARAGQVADCQWLLLSRSAGRVAGPLAGCPS